MWVLKHRPNHFPTGLRNGLILAVACWGLIFLLVAGCIALATTPPLN